MLPLDDGRNAQLVFNLVSNALSYGGADKTGANFDAANKAAFELIVENNGPQSQQRHLQNCSNHWYEAMTWVTLGLGLGLFIASKRAKTHGGSLTAI
jgi:signal transduction histidine kinase